MRMFLLGLVCCLLLVACQEEQGGTVFMPAVGSSEEEAGAATAVAETIFVPAVQSDTGSEAVEADSSEQVAVESGPANADVQFVAARATGDNVWTFNVTVAHPDTGWEDYADGWDVVLPDGTVVKADLDSPFTRLLLHPHETEQPFTRSQSGIVIPPEITSVTVRAHDLVDGFGGREVVVDLTADSGPDFTVQQ